MTDMPQTPAHAKPARSDHLWVLVIIAACCLIKVWPSWVGIGAEAGFPKIVKMPTDWTLAVVVEAYWAYAVYAWLAAAQGRRSRRFAMWSAAGVFVLSLTVQSTEGLMNAKAADAFANAMPVTVLALIAVLVHLRHTDRAEAEAAEYARRQAEREERKETAEAARIAELETALETAQGESATARQAASEAHEQAAQAARRIEMLERKLAAQKPARTRTKGAGAGRTKPPAKAPHADPETEVPDDLDARTQALGIWLGNPGISGRELAEKVGMKERWGQLRKNEFAASSAGPDSTSGPADPS